MALKSKCEEVNYKCRMVDKIRTERVKVYKQAFREERGWGSDRQDAGYYPTDEVIGFRRVFIAYQQCEQCNHTVEVGRKEVEDHCTVTFEEIAGIVNKKAEFEQRLKEFKEKQCKELEKFIRDNSPK